MTKKRQPALRLEGRPAHHETGHVVRRHGRLRPRLANRASSMLTVGAGRRRHDDHYR